MKIVAGDLDRIVQNALLYADPKAMRLNEVFFVVHPKGIDVFSCDDYVAVSDSCTADLDVKPIEFSFSVEDTDKLGDWIKEGKKVVHKYEVKLIPKFTGMSFSCDDTSTDDKSDEIFFPYLEPNHDSWDLVMQLLSEENDPRKVDVFAIRPERLTKLARLKANKDAPIDLRGVDVNNHLIVQFKKGSTLVGAVMPVKRSSVEEEFLWQVTDQ